MEKITLFEPARGKQPVICTMLLKGNRGAVEFVFGTGIYLPNVADEMRCNYGSMGHIVGYHSPKPIYYGQDPMHNNCAYTGGKCYYDGSALRADEWLKTLIVEGDGAIWSMLEKDYVDLFGEGD